MPQQQQFWMGSQAAYDTLIAAEIKAAASVQLKADSGESSYIEEWTYNKLVTIQDGVGILNISGTLVTGSAGYMAMYGVVGYDDIRNAHARLVADKSVIAILQNIGSGGGHVGGVMDAAQLVARVTAVKPVVTYSGSLMASAAMWVGAAAEYIVVAENTISGSIGILQVLTDRSEGLKMEGKSVKVIRAGKFKSLASGVEPISEEAVNIQTAQAESLYGVFIKYMAERRGVSVEVAHAKFGDGREFVGAQAKSAGLVDKVGSFEDAFTKAQQLGRARIGSVSNSGVPNKRGVQGTTSAKMASLPDNSTNSEGTQSMPQAFTAEQLQAMSVGIDMSATDPVTTPAATAPAASATPAAAPGATPAAAPGAAAEAKTYDALVVLQGMLAKSQEDLVLARQESAGFKASLDSMKPQFDAAIEIARNSVRTMGLHFGIQASAVASMPAADVLSEHVRVSGLFQAKFKAGSVAATDPKKDEAPKEVYINPSFIAAAKSLSK